MNILLTFGVIVWVVLSTLVLGTIAILCSFFNRTGNPVHLIARLWGRAILFVSRISVTVKGLENIDASRSYIYMSNHQSNFDIPVLLAHLTVQFRWLAKTELFKIPIFGRAMRGAGYISIDRFNQTSAFESLNQAARKIQEGASVMIFPEGTRSVDGKIRAFKSGGFVMAINAGVPIVPIVIKGTRAIMAKGSWRIKPGHVSLEVQPPVDTTAFTLENREALKMQIRDTICRVFEEPEKNGK